MGDKPADLLDADIFDIESDLDPSRSVKSPSEQVWKDLLKNFRGRFGMLGVNDTKSKEVWELGKKVVRTLSPGKPSVSCS